MNDNKKPSEPVKEARWAQEIHLSQLDDRIPECESLLVRSIQQRESAAKFKH